MGRMDVQLLYKHNPELEVFSAILEKFHIPELLHAEVSIWNCLEGLWQWVLQGEANCAIAFVMYAVFVVAFTGLDMIVLFIAAAQLYAGSAHERLQPTIAIARVLKKISMLDVAIMGVVVVVMGLKDFRAKGVIISAEQGLLVLLGAELFHYIAFYVVTAAAALECNAKLHDAESKGPLSV